MFISPRIISSRVLMTVVAASLLHSVIVAIPEASAQPSGVYLADPITAAATDPYATQPSGYFGNPSAGLIDQPVFDGSLLRNSPLAPRRLFDRPVPYRGRLFMRSDYLAWWMDPMDTPALVTESPAGTPPNQAGFLGGNQTSTLFGGELNGDFRSGVRVRGGWYVDPSRYWAVGGDYYQLFGSGDSFSASGPGTPGGQILARPFFNIVSGNEAAQFISLANVVSGDVAIDSRSRLQSFGINVQADAVNAPNAASQIANGCGREPRIDWIIGYRYVALDDELRFAENLVALGLSGNDNFVNSRESFETENRFQGLELGFVREIPFGRWWFETVSRIAIGTNAQKVRIDGSTMLTESGVPATFPGDLYAQTTNIGTYERNRFAVVPEVGATLGFHLSPRMSLTAGYTLVYFSNVVRAGDQIDTDLNPDLLPVANLPLTGAARPRFIFRQSDFFAHGATAGLDFRF